VAGSDRSSDSKSISFTAPLPLNGAHVGPQNAVLHFRHISTCLKLLYARVLLVTADWLPSSFLCSTSAVVILYVVSRPRLSTTRVTVPIFVPTLCLEALLDSAHALAGNGRKRLKLSKNAYRWIAERNSAMLLILLVFVVRDQEVGGSNPLAPANLFKPFQPAKPAPAVQNTNFAANCRMRGSPAL